MKKFLLLLKYFFMKYRKKTVYNEFFLKRFDSLKLEEIVTLTKSYVKNEYNTEKQITGITTLKKATENDLSFFTNIKYIEDLKNTKAGAVFVEEKFVDKVPQNTVAIINKNPHVCYTLCLETMFIVPIFWKNYGISRKATIAWSAKIGKKCEVQAGAFIGKNVVIGENCKICANAVINDNCIIGDGTYIGSNSVIMCSKIGKGCVIHNGAMIGQCGFGFAPDIEAKMIYKIPQLGRVIINDYVEVGANSCIDRGAFEDTIIGMGTKIDNLVHIAHNVKVGMGCFFASGVGIAGSTEIGNIVQLGGKVGIAGHLKIADGVEIAGNSGIAKSIDKPYTKWGGSPALPQRDWHRSHLIITELIKNRKNKND